MNTQHQNETNIDYAMDFILVRHLVLECLTFLKKYEERLKNNNNIKTYLDQATILYDELSDIHPIRLKNYDKLWDIDKKYKKLKTQITEDIYPFNLYIRLKINNVT